MAPAAKIVADKISFTLLSGNLADLAMPEIQINEMQAGIKEINASSILPYNSKSRPNTRMDVIQEICLISGVPIFTGFDRYFKRMAVARNSPAKTAK